MSSNELQFDWVATFLTDLSKDIDAEVVGEYICGILNVSHGSSESRSEIAELLSAYLVSYKIPVDEFTDVGFSQTFLCLCGFIVRTLSTTE